MPNQTRTSHFHSSRLAGFLEYEGYKEEIIIKKKISEKQISRTML
jgi:hypothetical protein